MAVRAIVAELELAVKSGTLFMMLTPEMGDGNYLYYSSCFKRWLRLVIWIPNYVDVFKANSKI